MGFRFGEFPPDDALAYWQSKTAISAKEFYKLEAHARATAFTVSGLTKLEQVQKVQDSLTKALKDGKGFKAWKREILKKLPKEWAGKGWHLETIYRTNIQTAYCTGRYKQMMKVKEMRPYWRYSAIKDGRTRPAHSLLHGTIKRHDDPFWDSWFPPNGFRCFPPGTTVLTPSGWVPIEAIRSNDLVIGGSGQKQRVTAVHVNPFDNHLIRLGFENGRIDTTPNHRVLTMRGWVRADRLQAGDVLVETIKLPPINSLVRDVRQTNAQIGNGAVPLPVQGEASVTFAFNGEIEVGNKDIQPFGTRFGKDHVVKNRGITQSRDMLDHHPFGFSRVTVICHKGGRISSYETSMGLGIFSPNFGASGGCGYLEFFGSLPGSGIGQLRFPQTGVVALAFHFGTQLFHRLRRTCSSFFRRMQPLSLNSLATFTRRNVKMAHKPHKRSGIDSPKTTKLSVGKLLDNVTLTEGFKDGAFLDQFDTIDNFRAWARSHCYLRKLCFSEKVPYTGNVYNLSVSNDESYIVPGATVHNCRCTVTSLSDRDMKRKGYKEDTKLKSGDFVVSDEYPMGFYLLPDNHFGTNQAKSFWKPDFKKYDDALGHAAKKAIGRVTGKEPLGIKTRADMVGVIKDKLAPLSKQGIKDVEFRSFDALMSTNAVGGINISTRKFDEIGMTPSKDLLAAFKKLGTDNKLSFNEEYALESLWHEIQHNNQDLAGPMPKPKHYSYALMETVNQWVSRRTYPRMLERLGGYKPTHLEKVKSDGYGYEMFIRRFDELLNVLGIDDAAILPQMEAMHRETGGFDYEPVLRELLSKISGKKQRKVSQCLKAIREKDYSACLKAI